MTTELSRGKWSIAAKDGLILASVTIVLAIISSLINSSSFILSSIIWILKTGGSLWLLHKFMKDYSAQADYMPYGKSFGFGFAVCLCSSLVVSIYLFISITLLFPEQMDAVMEIMQEAMSKGLYTAEQESAIERLMGNLPKYMLFVNFIYLSIFGAVASAITATFTKKDNLFGEEQQN